MEQQFSCKTCGGNLILQPNMRFAECENCGNVFELDENRTRFVNLYTQGDDAWSRKDFDEAIKFYCQIVSEDYTQSEAHFSIALCRYGIAYELDPVTLKEMPTCNRINRDSILNDKNYLAAVKYAGEQTRALYVERAQQIEKISRDFLKIADKEEPYDVFISYKRTDAYGRRTIDSQLAMKLYLFLRDRGIRAFFAEQTLRNVSGEKYEPYIFAALHSSKVMLLVGSCREYVEASWVKNEWRRFLHLSRTDPQKVLIPCYIGDDFYDIFPNELLSIQGSDMRSPVFHEEIVETIKKKLSDKTAPRTGTRLEDRYAKPELVKKIVDEMDCEEQLAVDALVLLQGNVQKTKEYINGDRQYQKVKWVCTECGTINTGDICRKPNCGTEKAQSQKVSAQREKLKEKTKRQKDSSRKSMISFLFRLRIWPMAIFMIIILIFIFSVASQVFSNWGRGFGSSLFEDLDIPGFGSSNDETVDLDTLDIVKTYYSSYSGTYAFSQIREDCILTVTSCDDEGNITATKEIILNGEYGKYALTGKIGAKRSSGEIEVSFTAGDWEVELEDYRRTETFTARISEDQKKISGNDGVYTALDTAKQTISSAADLQKLQNAEGLFMIEEDIDLTGTDFTPIAGFKGTLMGNNHTIQGLEIETSSDHVGFFSTLKGTVASLNFEDARITVSGQHKNIGILCGTLESGCAVNVKVSGTVTAEESSNVGGVIGNVPQNISYSVTNLTSSGSVSGKDRVGGIIGNIKLSSDSGSTVQLSNLQNSAAVTGGNDAVGGIVGYLEMRAQVSTSTLTAMGLKNTGSVTGTSRVGGIAGYASASYSSVLKDSQSSAAIEGQYYVGCIAGQLDAVNIDNCKNTGSTLTANGYTLEDGEMRAYVGGFVGSGAIASNCTNEVRIDYTGSGRFVGGIIGYAEGAVNDTIVGLKNSAPISGYSCVGGIFGGLGNNSFSNSSMYMKETENTAAVTGSQDYIGGIVGYLKCVSGTGSCSFYGTELKNTGTVGGKNYIGGIFGYVETDSYLSTVQDCRNSGAISGERYVGYVAGYAKQVTVTDCLNSGPTLPATG